MRADARRNYERLLEHARLVFAESGADASLDEIARRAGVASGTLYRHFPTRADLVEAVVNDRLTELAEQGTALLAAADPFTALATWLRATLAHGRTYRGLAAAVLTGDQERTAELHAALFDVGGALLARARDAGAVTADVDAVDLVKAVGAIAWATQDDPEDRVERLFALLLNGLR